ncbi:MAG: T9SS type A sorting domain-containing protein [Candidatus Zixiibacteriota bacterium]|nr:MAG: T9SS type A sorting domain-containing protein [candidate division Zixibacteria bacterium]
MQTLILILTAAILFPCQTDGNNLISYQKLDNPKLIFETIPDRESPVYQAGSGVITSSPGDTVGWTYYDYQCNGSTGQRIVLDEIGGSHVFWVRTGSNLYPPGIWYNHIDSLGNVLWPYEGIPIVENAGFPQAAADTEDYVGFSYKSTSILNNLWYSYFSLQHNIFRSFQTGIDSAFNPYISIDNNRYPHIVCYKYSPNYEFPLNLYYMGATDDGNLWTIHNIDKVESPSAIVTSSPVSRKTAVVFAHPTTGGYSWRNDVHYVETPDGLNWDWINDRINITEYGQNNDSLFACVDLDAVYDFNDNLHIIWNAHWATDQVIYYKTFLFHYDSQSGIISEVSSSDSVWISGCNPGAWNRPICKMSIGIQYESNNLYTVYTRFDTSDCSAGGYANGDLYMQYSLDGGSSWSAPENITNSLTPNCVPGDCDSDHWPSMAEHIDDYLHIFYVNDKDAGGIPQTEGTVTLNPMLYLAYPAVTTGKKDKAELPFTINLLRAYPNPFNARATIEFDLAAPCDVELTIYDITGAKVETIRRPGLKAGRHSILWDGDGVASGVYFARMEAGGYSQSIKMVLLK